MKRGVFPIFICTVWLWSSNAYAQIDQFVEAVRGRVTDAATAANVVLEADRHRVEAQRLFAAGQYDSARRELQVATDVLRAASQSNVEDDLLLREYIPKLNHSFNAIEDAGPTASVGNLPAGLSFIEKVLAENSLPTGLAAIVTVESGGDPIALSSKGARGLWQLMPDTARRYSLKVDGRVDERIDPVKSTYAAMRYLRDLYETFHDWPLALAAYNVGENRIQALIDATGIRRFEEMARKRLLPNETIHYVPAVLGLMAK